MERVCPHCDRLRPPSHFYPRTGQPRCRNRLTWTQARRFKLMTYTDQGLSNAQIATRMNVTEVAVLLARKRYGIPSVARSGLSATTVAGLMGIGCAKTVVRWIECGFLDGKRIRRMGPNHGWMVQRSDLYAFVEDERTWHLWTPERITDVWLRRHAEQVRGSVRFLRPGEVAERMFVQPTTVGQWIAKGYLPARKWGNWWIDERDLARFELPRIGGRNRHTGRRAA